MFCIFQGLQLCMHKLSFSFLCCVSSRSLPVGTCRNFFPVGPKTSWRMCSLTSFASCMTLQNPCALPTPFVRFWWCLWTPCLLDLHNKFFWAFEDCGASTSLLPNTAFLSAANSSTLSTTRLAMLFLKLDADVACIFVHLRPDKQKSLRCNCTTQDELDETGLYSDSVQSPSTL